MANKVFNVTSGDLFKFDPENIVIPKRGVLGDERANLPVKEDLVLDIMVRGVVLPVVITKGEDGEAVLVDGRQRVMAAREANRRLKAQGAKVLVRVPAVYRQGDDMNLYAAMVAANEHRQEDDAMGRARKAARLLALGASEEEAAVAFGVSRQTISNWLKLLKLSPEVAQAVKEGTIKPTAAGKLADLPKSEQAGRLADLTGGGRKPTVKRAVKVAKGKPAGRGTMRSKAMIEYAIIHQTKRVRGMDGLEILEWVIGRKDIPDLMEAPTPDPRQTTIPGA